VDGSRHPKVQRGLRRDHEGPRLRGSALVALVLLRPAGETRPSDSRRPGCVVQWFARQLGQVQPLPIATPLFAIRRSFTACLRITPPASASRPRRGRPAPRGTARPVESNFRRDVGFLLCRRPCRRACHTMTQGVGERLAFSLIAGLRRFRSTRSWRAPASPAAASITISPTRRRSIARRSRAMRAARAQYRWISPHPRARSCCG
jgi:hypothetical protein